MIADNFPVSLILKIDLSTNDRVDRLENALEALLTDGTIDGYYFLTRNGVAVHHRENHLHSETTLGRKIAAVQSVDLPFDIVVYTDEDKIRE